MSLYHIDADHNELLRKGHGLVDQFEELTHILKNKTGYSTLQKARIIENYLNVHFWQEEHVQANHLYEDMSKHVNDHLSISAALKNFITALELNLVTSADIDYFEEKIVLPFKKHFIHDDKKFMSFIKTKRTLSVL